MAYGIFFCKSLILRVLRLPQHRGSLDHESGALKEGIDKTVEAAIVTADKTIEVSSAAADKTKEVLTHQNQIVIYLSPKGCQSRKSVQMFLWSMQELCTCSIDLIFQDVWAQLTPRTE